MTASDGLRLGLDARLLAYNRGGIARYITSLGRALAALPSYAPFDDLVAVCHRKDRQRSLADHGWRSVTAWTPPHHRWERVLLAAELAGHRLDLLHSPDHIALGAGRARSVLTVHDLAFLLYPHTHSPQSRRYYRQITWAVQRADRIIAVSQATKEDLVREVGADPARIRVVYEAAFPGWDTATGSPPLGLSPLPQQATPQPYFLAVASVQEPRKNLPRLVEALAEVRRSHPRARLVIAGSPGPDTPAIQEAVARRDLADSVILPGSLDDRHLGAYYRDAVALVYPSLYEGFGLPMLEAMAAGTAVIAANVSSLPEIAGDAVLLVDPHQVESMAEAMRRVVDDEALRADLVARGHSRERQFTWERAAQDTLAVYREALS